ncbi:MAG: hypothetical protein ACE37B_24795 [Ilumatobacter sp.]|uniref:hypothetical protein n=1 Tax=Ilumatobacter sp. TaxID=1967498 RepID=UPI003919ED2B
MTTRRRLVREVRQRRRAASSLWGAVIAFAALTGCSGGAPATDGPIDSDDVPALIADVGSAIAAVDEELGGPQEYFEVTSNGRFVNVFVATNEATVAVPYVFLHGEVQPPGPAQEGAEGRTFVASDLDFDATRILSRVEAELPATSIEAISVYGDGIGATYVLAGRSEAGGLLDIVVGPDGQILSVDPL